MSRINANGDFRTPPSRQIPQNGRAGDTLVQVGGSSPRLEWQSLHQVETVWEVAQMGTYTSPWVDPRHYTRVRAFLTASSNITMDQPSGWTVRGSWVGNQDAGPDDTQVSPNAGWHTVVEDVDATTEHLVGLILEGSWSPTERSFVGIMHRYTGKWFSQRVYSSWTNNSSPAFRLMASGSLQGVCLGWT